ncbi:MarR family winged helix-turn-helix transcriptional regulator [Vibrio paucivorans]|uniref:MarR family transcriptional regulator n=1 Tax=Vibrio paucivorans TaxID=2829489 RepID=A0A9X3HTD4_9VIBR|nr:MarR family transcriptional regulator [Vibrio paucivorans]MCW8335548.1 MarR family transcriptional regulator [Vibrio paucivorans]
MAKMTFKGEEHQKLENQLCFPLYAASRMVTRLYQPLLDQHHLTYPQYIILLILWQQDGITVGEIGKQALLNSNTLTPILKRMEQSELISRQRDEDDERKMLIHLTAQGGRLQQELSCLPSQLIENVDYDVEKAEQLKALLHELIDTLER